MGEIIYESLAGDFFFSDEGKGKGLILTVTTANGKINQGYPSSIKLNQGEMAITRATKMQIKDLNKIREEDGNYERIKDILRENNPKGPKKEKEKKDGKSRSGQR